jgi:hypothetical protein
MREHDDDEKPSQMADRDVVGRARRVGAAPDTGDTHAVLVIGGAVGVTLHYRGGLRVARSNIVVNSFAYDLRSSFGSTVNWDAIPSIAFRIVTAIARVENSRNSPRC